MILIYPEVETHGINLGMASFLMCLHKVRSIIIIIIIGVFIVSGH